MSGSAFDQKTLWATDGTEAGTEQLSTTVFQSWVFNTEFDGKFYFGGLPWNSTDWGLYVTDGTTQGTGKVATDIPAPDVRSPMGFVEVDNELIFTWGDRFLSLMKREDPETLVPVVQIARSASGTIEGVDRPVEFAISRIGSTDEPLRVTYSVGGTARAGSDYEVLPGHVTIPRGQAAVHVPIFVVDDEVFEQRKNYSFVWKALATTSWGIYRLRNS